MVSKIDRKIDTDRLATVIGMSKRDRIRVPLFLSAMENVGKKKEKRKKKKEKRKKKEKQRNVKKQRKERRIRRL